jgi:hypothetical protein
MALPLHIVNLINEYSKPLTRPDWKTRPKFTIKQLFQGLKKKRSMFLMRQYYIIIRGYCDHYIRNKYNEYINTGTPSINALMNIETECGIPPEITRLMCNIL